MAFWKKTEGKGPVSRERWAPGGRGAAGQGGCGGERREVWGSMIFFIKCSTNFW